MTVTVISKSAGRVRMRGTDDSMTVYFNKTFYLYIAPILITLKVFFDFTVISNFRSFKPMKE